MNRVQDGDEIDNFWDRSYDRLDFELMTRNALLTLQPSERTDLCLGPTVLYGDPADVLGMRVLPHEGGRQCSGEVHAQHVRACDEESNGQPHH